MNITPGKDIIVDRRPKDSMGTGEYLNMKNLALEERHKPLTGTTPDELREAVESDSAHSLQETLLGVEKARLEAMLRLGDDSGFKQFLRPLGTGVAAGAAAFLVGQVIEEGAFNFGSFDFVVFGVMLMSLAPAVMGHMWLGDTKGEMEVKARDYDHERVLRAIDQHEQARYTDDNSDRASAPG